MPSKKKKKSEIIEIKVSEQKTGDDPKLVGRRHFTVDILVLENELVVAERLSDLGAVDPVQELLKNELRIVVERYIEGANDLLSRAASLAANSQDEEEAEEATSDESGAEEGLADGESLLQPPPQLENDNRFSQSDMFSGNIL